MMNNLALAADGAWKVLVASLVLGAGLPCLRARESARWPGPPAAAEVDGEHAERHPVGNVLLGRAACSWSWPVWPSGITIIVASGFGKAVSFEHIYPTIVSK